MDEHNERFFGTVVRVFKQQDIKGAKIRPSWVDENDDTDDIFCHFSEAPYLVEGMIVSFRLDQEPTTGRWAAFAVSRVIKNVETARPEWYPDPVCLDLMRNTWKRTKNRDEVILTEITNHYSSERKEAM